MATYGSGSQPRPWSRSPPKRLSRSYWGWGRDVLFKERLFPGISDEEDKNLDSSRPLRLEILEYSNQLDMAMANISSWYMDKKFTIWNH